MAREKKSSVYYSDIFTKEMCEFYRKNPVRFVEDLIFQRNPDYFLSDQQKQFLNSFVSKRKRIAVKSGKGVGKTSSVSFLIIWFLCCFDNPKIVCSAPTAATLYSALWSEIALWLNRSAVKDIFDHTATKLYLKEEPKTWYCEPRTAKDPISMQGIHQENLLIIVDEASGLRQDIFESLDTTLTGKNNKLCLIGNPNLVTGPFAESFGKFSDRWVNLTFSALDSPFVTRDQIDYYEQKYGKNHDLYKVNILGEFPSGSPESFLKLSDINAAIARYDLVEASGEFEIGLDVARYGDDSTVLYYRRGFKVFPPKVLDQNSIPEAAQLVLTTVEEIRKKYNYNNKIRVKVDETGLGCLTRNTQVLTVDGWKNASSLVSGDKLYSKNSSGNVVIEEVINNIEREETRILRVGDMEFSWSHLLPYKTRKEHRFILNNWEKILENKYIYLDNLWNWEGIHSDFHLDELRVTVPNGGTRICNKELNVDSKTFASFIGWFVSEGCTSGISEIRISQRKDTHRKEIEEILSKICYWKRKNNDYIIFNKNLCEWLKRECYVSGTERGAYRKKVPSWVKMNDKETIESFLTSFRNGDGTIHHGTNEYFTTSKTLSDDLLECIYKVGRYANKLIKQLAGSKSMIEGRVLTRKVDCYCIYEYKNPSIGTTTIDKIEYYDNVYNITITGDTKLFYTRTKFNNKAYWTHNGGAVDLLLLDRDHNIEVIGCNNGGKGDERYHNEISCMWGLFRDYLCNIGLPEDTILVEELSSRNWKLSNTGKTVIEPKTDFKKRYGSSPDRSDALMLCFYNKQSEKTIIKNFDPLDDHLIKDRVEYLGEDRYGSLFYGRDVSSSMIYASWNGSRLYVYDEHVSMDAVINVISNILSHGKLSRLIGNDRMFNVKGDDLSSKFRRYGVNIYENFAFNEISAIETLNNMITQRRIVFNRNCVKMIEQLSSWKMENSRYDMEDKYGLCYSLLYLISELKYKIENKTQIYCDPIAIANSYGYTQPSSNENKHWMLF